MIINRDTTVCISIASRPGNLGATIFNEAFRELSLNYIYKPFLVEEKDLKEAIIAIKALGIRGCGISMPHKMKVMEYLDEIDETAGKIGAINTIVNDSGILKGYNTDYEGVKTLLADRYSVKGANVLIAGAGGAARAIIQAIKEGEVKNIFITNRDEVKGEKLAEELEIIYISWKDKDKLSGEMLVNATPVGMKEDDPCIFEDKTIEKFKAVLDVVVSPHNTYLINKAKELGKIAIPGIKMASLQGMAQFKLYTGADISTEIIEKSIGKYLTSN